MVGLMHVGLTADGVADLLGHVSDLVHGIRQEVVCFQEVKRAERQQLERDAHVAVVVKPVQHLHTVADGKRDRDSGYQTGEGKHRLIYSLVVVWISLANLLQDIDFQFGCFSVFL